jgi:hypothetical protein
MSQHLEYNHRTDREKTLFLYTSALERGDLGAVANILYQAEQDAQLEQMILEVNEIYGRDDTAAVQDDAAALVRHLVSEHLPSATVTEEPLLPLTVGQVASRMESDYRLTNPVRQELTAVATRLRQMETPLPGDLSKRGVMRFFNDLGISASQQLQKLFRETALLLSMRQQQGQSLAAARRQHPPRPSDGMLDEKESE